MSAIEMKDWKWLNESQIIHGDRELVIYAPAKTDWYNNPVPKNGKLSAPQSNAPFYYLDVEGDFVFHVKVTPNHKSTFDACSIMIIQDEKMWAKLAFEASDYGTKAAVCVVTNGISDDANGCNIDQNDLWLKCCRVGDVFSALYSLDGKKYDMVRLFHLPADKCVKVGLEAQCPSGEGGLRYFSDIVLENKTVHDLRKGI